MRIVAALLMAVMLVGQPAAAQSFRLGLDPAPRDRYEAIPEAYAPLVGELPSSVDLSPLLPPPGEQSDNSCVGWATAYAAKTYQELREHGWEISRPDGSLNTSRVFSPSFIYNQINGGVDRGSHFANAFRIMIDQGNAPISAMPYSGNPFERISPAARQAAEPYRIDSFRTLDHRDVNAIRGQLAASIPVVIGATMYDNFMTLPYGGVWRDTYGIPRGGHAMAVVGYDDNRRAFKVLNSWGRDWSSNGYGWISYDLFPRVVNEAYIMIDLDGVEGVPVPGADVWTPPTIAPERSVISVNTGMTEYNAFGPQGEIGLRLHGTFSVPAGVRGSMQVVIPLQYFDSGLPVGSLTPAFALPTGQAAFGAPLVWLNGFGVQNATWYAFLPYCALNVPKATYCVPPRPMWGPPQFIETRMQAVPTLYIDNFGVARSEPVNVGVRL